MKKLQGPFVGGPAGNRLISANVLSPLVGTFSGEIAANKTVVLGAAKAPGRVTNVFHSVESAGRELGANVLSLSVDVYINGTTCLTTKPVIAYVSGEEATNKTSANSQDTGITAGVIDADANSFVEGDLFTAKFILTRTASPSAEMKNAALVIELEPDQG